MVDTAFPFEAMFHYFDVDNGMSYRGDRCRCGVVTTDRPVAVPKGMRERVEMHFIRFVEEDDAEEPR